MDIMEIIKSLLGYLVRIAIAFFVAALVWWLVTLLIPSLSLSSFIAKKGHSFSELIPSPRAYQGLLGKQKVQNETTNLYVPAAPFSGYGDLSDTGYYLDDQDYYYITYNNKGGVSGKNETIHTSPKKENTSSSPSLWKSKAIQNLSIYQGGHIYTGLYFTGEARKEMFRSGKFPIVVIDGKGVVVGVSTASAIRDGKLGYLVFETKINYTLPNGVPCTMIFEEGRSQGETVAPFRTGMPIRCN